MVQSTKPNQDASQEPQVHSQEGREASRTGTQGLGPKEGTCCPGHHARRQEALNRYPQDARVTCSSWEFQGSFLERMHLSREWRNEKKLGDREDPPG